MKALTLFPRMGRLEDLLVEAAEVAERLEADRGLAVEVREDILSALGRVRAADRQRRRRLL